MNTFVLVFIFIFELIRCQTPEFGADRVKCTIDPGCHVESDSLDFLLLGDTGGLPPPLYTSIAQRQVAKSLVRIMDEEHAKFVINLGDNFYLNGVRDLKDTRFWRSFEDPYSLVRIPWFVIAGNHDHLGNVSAEIAHTFRSNLWTFPNLFYSVRYTFGKAENMTSVRFVMIDTIQLCGNCIDVGGSDLISWLTHTKLVPDHPDDPQAAEKQWNWIENQLQNSTEDYLFVGGHYPIYSVCEHGPNTCLINRLDPLLRKHNATACFSGHDHNLQFLQHSNNSDGSSMTYIVSGASSRSDRSVKNIRNVPPGSLLFRYPTGWNPFSQLGFSNGGFVNVKLTKENAEFTFYDGKLQNKYQNTLKPRNKLQVF